MKAPRHGFLRYLSLTWKQQVRHWVSLCNLPSCNFSRPLTTLSTTRHQRPHDALKINVRTLDITPSYSPRRRSFSFRPLRNRNNPVMSKCRPRHLGTWNRWRPCRPSDTNDVSTDSPHCTSTSAPSPDCPCPHCHTCDARLGWHPALCSNPRRKRRLEP